MQSLDFIVPMVTGVLPSVCVCVCVYVCVCGGVTPPYQPKIFSPPSPPKWFSNQQLTFLPQIVDFEDILDPRSQRAGSYKISAVIVNV